MDEFKKNIMKGVSMNINNNLQYKPNTNFAAKLKIDYRKINPNEISAERWGRIADSFEMRTENPRDFFELKLPWNLRCVIFNDNIELQREFHLDKHEHTLSKDSDDNKITDALVALYKLFRTESKLFLDVANFMKSCQKQYNILAFSPNGLISLDNRFNEQVHPDSTPKFIESIRYVVKEYENKSKEKDPLLKQWLENELRMSNGMTIYDPYGSSRVDFSLP